MLISNYINNQITFLDIAEPWQLGFQDPATPVMEGIINFHHDLMFFLIVVTVFVCWMLFRVITLFDEKKIKYLLLLYMVLLLKLFGLQYQL